MALTIGNPILASEIIALKERVKAEMLRRDKVGSLVEYGGSDYDYTVTPAAGNPILPEHFNKLIIPMNAINNIGYSEISSGDPIPALDKLEAFLTKSEAFAVTGSASNCKTTCSGLCVGTCQSACGTGCSGTCSSSCKNTCDRDCADDCYTGCSGSCDSSCKTDCAKGCAWTCNSNCSGGCKTDCRMYCAKGVTGTA